MRGRLRLLAIFISIVISTMAGTTYGLRNRFITETKITTLKDQKSKVSDFAEMATTSIAMHKISQIKTGTIISFPYVESFDKTNITTDGWLISDASTSASFKMDIGSLAGLKAISGNSYLISGYDTSISRNAWAFSPSVSLTANKTYYIYIYARAAGYADVKDEFKITVGTNQTSASQTTILIDRTGANAVIYSGWVKLEGVFRPSVTKSYVFGINHCTVAKDVNAVAFEDFTISENRFIPAPVAKIYSSGGLNSLQHDSVYVSKNEELSYYAKATNVAMSSWVFDGSANNITQLQGDSIVTVNYDAEGQHIAKLNVLGLDGSSISQADTVNYLIRPQGITDIVWNINPTDGYTVNTTGTANNYAYGLNGTYNKIAEQYYLPSNVSVKLNALYFCVYYYQLLNTNRSKAFTITIQSKDSETGLPGAVLATYTPTFATLFGTTTINGSSIYKSYALTTALAITGSFYVVLDFTNAGLPGATNNIGLISTTERPYEYGTSYVYYQNQWTSIGYASGGIAAYLTYVIPISTTIKTTTTPQLVVYIADNKLHIEQATVGSKLSVFDLSGKNIYSTVLKADNTALSLSLKRGVYLIKVDDKVSKIIVK